MANEIVATGQKDLLDQESSKVSDFERELFREGAYQFRSEDIERAEWMVREDKNWMDRQWSPQRRSLNGAEDAVFNSQQDDLAWKSRVSGVIPKRWANSVGGYTNMCDDILTAHKQEVELSDTLKNAAVVNPDWRVIKDIGNNQRLNTTQLGVILFRSELNDVPWHRRDEIINYQRSQGLTDEQLAESEAKAKEMVEALRRSKPDSTNLSYGEVLRLANSEQVLMLENTSNPEIKKEVEPTIFLLQRHGAYDNSVPKADDSQEVKDKAGWLTPEGVESTRNSVRAKVKELLAAGKPIDFVFLNSPTAWEDKDGNQYGRRAEQSAQIASEEVAKVLKDEGLTPNEARILEFGKTESGTRADSHLVEPNIFYIPGAEDPRAYIKAMLERYGKEGRWEGYHRMEEELEPVRTKTGAESSADIANRNLFLMRAVDRWANQYDLKKPDRTMVVWMETHNDSLRATLQHGLKAGEDAYDYEPGLNEILQLELDCDHNLKTSFKGKEYSIELPR